MAGPRELPRFPAAGQPDVVLAAQKDAHVRREVRQEVAAAADAVLGPFASVTVQPELRLLAELGYFGLTTLRGQQTLGEEYCDILAVDRSGRRLPGRLNRLALLVFGVIAPYVVKRVQSGGWQPLLGLFKKPLSARERAEILRQQMLRRAQGAAATGSGGPSSAGPSSDGSFDYAAAAKRWLPWLLGWSGFLYRAHLAVFYLRGEFHEWSKRLAGVRYIHTREPKAQRASYRVLGYFLATQLAVESAAAVRQTLYSVGRAWGLIVDKRVDSAQGGDELDPELVVPSAEEAARLGFRRGVEHIKCGICLCPVEDPACPPCGHLFCYEHALEAVAAKSECPLCRRECEPSDVVCVYYHL